MFEQKQKELISRPTSKTPAKQNSFVTAGLKQSAKTTSLGNGALKLETTGNDFVDQFGKISNYRTPRSYAEVAKDMELLWSQNPEMTMRLTLYIRMITRTVQFADGTKTSTTQRGQGLKNEGIFRMLWVAINHPDVFVNNIAIFIAIGSWKDIIQMLSYDLQYHAWESKKLNWEFFGQLILAGLENKNTSNLVKKFLPSIKASSKCTTIESQADTMIGKWLSKCLFGNKEGHGTYKQYRRLKSSGTAHEWQKLISQKKLLNINFDSIHGRALSLLVSSKFLKNHGLEAKYQAWIESKPVAKYTGYVYELMNDAYKSNLTPYQISTINKQFLGLVETGRKGMKEGDGGYLVVVDSSDSMSRNAIGTNIHSYNIAMSMALYFSYMLKGAFNGIYAEFSSTTHIRQWKGSTPVEKIRNAHSRINGSTNFQSVADHFGSMLKSGVPESDFPTGILCVSDGCFNHTGSEKTNTKAFLERLRAYGFSKEYRDNFKIVLWDIPNGYYGASQTAFEDFADCPNLFHMSGLDPAAVAFLIGVEGRKAPNPKNSEELFEAAMDQEALNNIII